MVLFKQGIKNPELNAHIIQACHIEDYTSTYKMLQHFYHVDTCENNDSVRLQGYVFVEDALTTEFYVPECEVSLINDKPILFLSKTIKKV